MTHEEMTVHQALVELKVLNDRIRKAIAGGTYVATKRHVDKKIGGVPCEKYCTDTIKASYDSVMGLIHRRDAIKRAVVKSNAVTNVTIDGKEYTVAEAIDMNAHGLEYTRDLYSAIQRQYSQAQSVIAINSGENLQQKAERYVTGLYGGKENIESEEAKAQIQAYVEANSQELVDPIGIQKVMKDLEQQIACFMTAVDAALSVSNAVTTIKIDY